MPEWLKVKNLIPIIASICIVVGAIAACFGSEEAVYVLGTGVSLMIFRVMFSFILDDDGPA